MGEIRGHRSCHSGIIAVIEMGDEVKGGLEVERNRHRVVGRRFEDCMKSRIRAAISKWPWLFLS